jgi:hypothetical protein
MDPERLIAAQRNSARAAASKIPICRFTMASVLQVAEKLRSRFFNPAL